MASNSGCRLVLSQSTAGASQAPGENVMLPYRSVAATAVPDSVILACQDHAAAAASGWFSCWLPEMVQVADPPAPPTRLDR
jgi:hypothetical protein